MLYLRNTTELQWLMIPKDINSASRDFSLLVKSTVDKTALSLDVLDNGTFDHYYNVKLNLPSGMVDGEYEYSLLEDGKSISKGLLMIGKAERVSEYNKTISYEQYYRE